MLSPQTQLWLRGRSGDNGEWTLGEKACGADAKVLQKHLDNLRWTDRLRRHG